jgi:hypothetical protein
MTIAVELDAQLDLRRIEVEDERPDAILPPEL